VYNYHFLKKKTFFGKGKKYGENMMKKRENLLEKNG
jgi:hypothetical protein